MLAVALFAVLLPLGDVVGAVLAGQDAASVWRDVGPSADDWYGMPVVAVVAVVLGAGTALVAAVV